MFTNFTIVQSIIGRSNEQASINYIYKAINEVVTMKIYHLSKNQLSIWGSNWARTVRTFSIEMTFLLFILLEFFYNFPDLGDYLWKWN